MNLNSKAAIWIGRIMSGLIVAFFAFDGGIKVIPLDMVVQGMAEFGIPAELARPLGVVTLVSTALYAIPRTSVLGAILLTGYLGGAIATHLRDTGPLLPHNLLVIFIGALVWGGLYLRDPRLRALIPLRQR